MLLPRPTSGGVEGTLTQYTNGNKMDLQEIRAP